MGMAAHPAPSPVGSAASAPRGSGRSVYIETYGCQMNVSDTEILLGILNQNGYREAKARRPSGRPSTLRAVAILLF